MIARNESGMEKAGKKATAPGLRNPGQVKNPTPLLMPQG
jgi:hypothetical protein